MLAMWFGVHFYTGCMGRGLYCCSFSGKAISGPQSVNWTMVSVHAFFMSVFSEYINIVINRKNCGAPEGAAKLGEAVSSQHAVRSNNPCEQQHGYTMARFKDVHKINIGQLIKQRLDSSGMSYTHFAKLIHVSRPALYGILSGKTIDIDRLILISEVLGYDFIGNEYYAELPPECNVLEVTVDAKMLINNEVTLKLKVASDEENNSVKNTDESVKTSDINPNKE